MNGIKFLLIFLLSVVCSYLAKARSEPPVDMDKNTQEMAIAHGYPCENFTISTPDDYILGIFRIPGKKHETLEYAKKQHRQPVILQHGLIDSSDNFLVNENPCLAYMLADAGFDVWLPNFRGNEYSRYHQRLSPDTDAAFWNYSIDEVIKYDVHTIFELIISETGYEKISHVGHSMGGGTILAAASRDPAFYGAHVRSIVGLSPSTSNVHANYMMKLAQYLSLLDVLEFFGANELFNFHPKMQSFISVFCKNAPDVCTFFIRLLAGNDPLHDNASKYQVLFNHYPVSTSVHQMRHILQQTMQVGYYEYRQNDSSPFVEYDFTKVPANIPVAVFSGSVDKLVSTIDAEWLRDKLIKGGSLRMYKEFAGYGHLTYLLPWHDYQCYFDTLAFLKQQDGQS